MKHVSTYKVRLGKDLPCRLQPTLDLYKGAVIFFVDVILREWDSFASLSHTNEADKVAESLCISTASRPETKYRFDEHYYKFPCYLRRSAIMKAHGLVSSYKSNLANWEKEPADKRGKKPSIPTVGDVFPAMYRDNCFVRTGTYTARIKVFVRNTWDWIDVTLRKCDVDYITRHCSDRKECVPTLSKRGKNWSLDFAFEKRVALTDKPAAERRILAVDLGINNAATCCVMDPDGTVVARRFLSLRTENDCLGHALTIIRRAQRSGAKRMPALWAKADGINRNIAERTASFIVTEARSHGCETVVMEHLGLNGKKNGSKRQRLHMWKTKYAYRLVTDKCHLYGMRVSTVCARNTSRLAFDGSGEVLRGKKSQRTNGSWSLCEFKSGKVYNCDLNASYNIGARYFIREILGSMPERARSEAEAKVPALLVRSTCTLSGLKDLRAVMPGSSTVCTERVMSGKTRDSRAPQGQTGHAGDAGRPRLQSWEASRS